MKSFKIYLKTIFDRKKHPLSKILSSFFSGVLLLFLISILPFEKGIYGRNNSFMDHKCVTLSKTLPGISYTEKKDLDYCIEKANSQAEDIKASWPFRNRIKDVKTTYYTDTDIGLTVFFDKTTRLDDLGKIDLLNSRPVPTDVISVITDQYEENNIKNPNDLKIRETNLLKESGINYQVLLKRKETIPDYITSRLTYNSTVIFVPLSFNPSRIIPRKHRKCNGILFHLHGKRTHGQRTHLPSHSLQHQCFHRNQRIRIHDPLS